MKECWKNIEGFEGHYLISNQGRVKSLCRKVDHRGRQITMPEKIKKLQINATGYYFLRLYLNGKGKNIKIHRMVAKAFISNELGYKYVNHKDGNKKNNHCENLEWCTPLENNLHALRTGLKIMRYGAQVHTAVLSPKQVLEIRSMKGLLTEMEISKIYNCGKSTIHAILSRRSWKNI